MESFPLLAQAPGDVLVGLAGLGDARRVVVEEHHGGSVVAQDGDQDFAGVDRGPVDGALKEFFDGPDAVPVVQLCGDPHNSTNV